MILGGESRGADAAVWHRSAIGGHEGKYRRSPPVLAVEVQGELEDESTLHGKAAWYLEHGVAVVWLVFPRDRRVVVVTPGQTSTLGLGSRIPAHPSLPDLEPSVDDLFAQISGG